jgi:hypothetical protein
MPMSTDKAMLQQLVRELETMRDKKKSKRVECEGCGNPDVYNGCKCKYCKRWYKYAKEEPYQQAIMPDWIGAKMSGGYVPITANSSDEIVAQNIKTSSLFARWFKK